MVPGMIGREYFRRQATTLRKMVKVAKDPVVADRLSDMALDFEERARDEGGVELQPRQGVRGADAEGHG
jgi:hypothetical protein